MADETTPSAPVPEKVQETSVADNQTNINTEQTNAPEQKPVDLGLTQEQADRFKKFIDNNGGFDSAFKRLKVDVSTQEQKPVEAPANVPEPQKPVETPQPTSPQLQPQTLPTPPAGAITQDEMMTQYYFEQLSKQEKYAPIAKEIANGELLKEMASLGIEVRNPDGSFNDAKINTYLGIKAQTVPATPPSAEPDASSAPLSDYANVGEKIESMEQARRVLSQPGHPMTQNAHEYLKSVLNPQNKNNVV